MADFLSSRGSLIVAGILLLAGCVCFFLSRKDAASARREKTTIGLIDGVSGGRHTSYYFEFKLDGVKIYDESGSCQTALSSRGCEVGAPVLVYYDHDSELRTKLKEFGAASSDDSITGFFMVFGGLLIIVLHFLFKRALESPDDSDGIDVDQTDEGPEAIHVVPDE
jgi:hypothetical protein